VTHPANDWEFNPEAEEGFVKWFNDFYGRFSFRAEYFYEDCEVEDEKTRKDLMYKWLHAAYVAAYAVAYEEGFHEGLSVVTGNG
jgi:hypothetical protein